MQSGKLETSIPAANGIFPARTHRNATILSLGRIFVTSLVLGTSLFIPEHGKNILQIPPNTQLFILLSAIYLYSIICLSLIKFFKDSQWFIFTQILIDALFVTAFVRMSGGEESIFIFLYFFSIIAGGLFLSRGKLLLIVLFTSIFYVGIIVKTEPIDAFVQSRLPSYIWDNRFRFYRLGVQVLALWGVAFLTSILSREIQKRKKEYQKLERFNENLLQSINSGILTVNLDNILTYLNKAGEQILGTPTGKGLGENIRKFFPELGKYIDNSSKIQTHPHHTHLILKRPGARDKIIGFSISTLFDSENNPGGKIIIFQDLTRYKAMEKRVHESEKLATVGRFAAGLAHEIRNPLASLSGSIQVLKNTLSLNGTEEDLMDIVLRETDRLNRLVSDFLQFSQFGRENLQDINLYPFIGEIISILSKENQGNGVHLINRIPKDLVVHSDRDKLKQVFWNILINAIQAKNKKEHIVSVRCVSGKNGDDTILPDTDSITIMIQDNGRGIPKDVLRKIFEPFFTTRSEGTGLGLSIAYQIMNALGGSISVRSVVGKGTIFQLILPA
jgi:two-component system sensor histidine kinase PilS (NtrC family)